MRPVQVRESVGTGGVIAGVTHEMEVEEAKGADVRDGAVVESRLLKGKVISKENFGGGWIIYAGPENRWGNEDF